ncbi:FAS1-like dehydratase domain-containing protein [Bacillus sp. DJP31]|uniref:FAS1-like dehydratase domain-containing protein n=1 Tax=Bacillus sp. DJP31 TaxID=3409789 RepID=UPI003BB6D04D
MFVEEQFVGSNSETIQITITEQLVKDYLQAIDDFDHQKTLTIPSTLPFIFWPYFSVPWLDGKGPLVHGDQQFQYKRSLIIGETYECYITFNKAAQKRNLQFLEHDLLITKNDEEIAKASSNFIIIGKKEDASI